MKHLSYSDQIEHDAKRESYFEVAKGQGLLTAEEKLAQLRKNGQWTDAMDADIKRIRQFIDGMIEGKKQPHVARQPSMLAGLNRDIAKEQAVLDGKLAAKETLLGLTCDSYADREISDHYIYENIFADSELHTPFFSPTTFDYLDNAAMNQVSQDYNRIVEGCSELNVKKLAMQGFFQNYFGLTGEQLAQFFGKPICALTFFQVRLLSYGSLFRSIYQSHDVRTFPKAAQEDPDLLIDTAAAVAKGKQEMQKVGANDEDAIVLGARKDDAKALGIKQGANPMGEIAKHGGNIIDWMAKR